MTVYTVENFVDIVNEVLLTVTKDEITYQKIQDELIKYLKHEISIDQFAFEFTMLTKEAK
jgi:trehalose-6-phosphate synthase